jgi:hypothetical protein
MDKCPICGEELEVHEDWIERIQCECYMFCKHCKQYCYEYMYGNYRESIGDPDGEFYREFIWHYTESNADGIARENDIRKAIEELKQLRREESQK